MVKGMRIVCEASDKKKAADGSPLTYQYLEIDFGYRVAKIFDFDKLLFPELCGITAEAFYSLKPGSSLPVKFDLPAIHNDTRK